LEPHLLGLAATKFPEKIPADPQLVFMTASCLACLPIDEKTNHGAFSLLKSNCMAIVF